MTNNYLNSLTPFTRSTDTSWQSQLRHSVRLYLALGDQPINAQELEDLLRRTEDELLEHLLAGDPPTSASIQQAQSILDMAQSELLGSESEIQLLLREMSDFQSISSSQPSLLDKPATDID